MAADIDTVATLRVVADLLDKQLADMLKNGLPRSYALNEIEISAVHHLTAFVHAWVGQNRSEG